MGFKDYNFIYIYIRTWKKLLSDKEYEINSGEIFKISKSIYF